MDNQLRMEESVIHSDFDYLIIGHLVRDLLPDQAGISNRYTLGGTAAYAALTARAYGCRVAIVSSFDPDLELAPLNDITIFNNPSAATTSFQNIYTPSGRIQKVHSLADPLTPDSVPQAWQTIPLVHIGPVTGNLSPNLLDTFPDSWIGLTPQGWLRDIDREGKVRLQSWKSIVDWVPRADAVVLSREDIKNDRDAEDQLAGSCRILVVTDANNGAFLYHKNNCTHIEAPNYPEIDPTGCGDIFAAIFFAALAGKSSPVEAAKLATNVAALAITRSGLNSTPAAEEIAQTRNKLQL